jgi:hypothetical protein
MRGLPIDAICMSQGLHRFSFEFTLRTAPLARLWQCPVFSQKRTSAQIRAISNFRKKRTLVGGQEDAGIFVIQITAVIIALDNIGECGEM